VNSIVRVILAIVVGIVLGGVVNMGLILLGPSIIPPPPGVDMSSAESMAASMHLFKPQHLLFPFLAHALGTLAGAIAAYWLAGTRQLFAAYVIGVVFLLGGIAATFMIPAPLWFILLDLGFAYMPMAWLGTKLGQRLLSYDTS